MSTITCPDTDKKYSIFTKEGKKVLESINLKTGEYLATTKVDLVIGDKLDFYKLINRGDKFGKYSCSVLSKIILYASSLIPDVTNEHNNIDEALRLGFNWTIGPFEILDQIGIKEFAEKNQSIKLNRFLKDLYLNEKIDWYGKKQLYLEADLRTLRRKNFDHIDVDYLSKSNISFSLLTTIILSSEPIKPYSFRV